MILNAGNAADRRALQTMLGLKNTSARQKASKYKNKRVWADGHKFDSQGEYGFYLQLVAREERGEISNIKVHPVYELMAWSGVCECPAVICKMIPDFEFIENGELITADFKGMITTEWRLKAKIFKANTGREIRVVKK